MIAPTKRVPAWHKQFLAMVPAIQRYAQLAFRSLDPEAREEAIEEVVANSLVAFVRLHERGKADIAYPVVLARFAVAQLSDGRRVGSRLNSNDVMSPAAQRKHGFSVERLNRRDADGQWVDHAVLEDRNATPADVATTRMDFKAWLGTMSQRNREVTKLLAAGESTGETARQFGLSAGRVSQLRGELKQDWQQFQRERACCGS